MSDSDQILCQRNTLEVDEMVNQARICIVSDAKYTRKLAAEVCSLY